MPETDKETENQIDNELEKEIKNQEETPEVNYFKWGGERSEINDILLQKGSDYAIEVITERALPDIRDGLKPVQRRIIFGMMDEKLFHNKKYKKSAQSVGAIIGKLHPHGDKSVYDAMVRMAQDFSYRVPLVDGQGNFGCFTGDTKIKMHDGSFKSFEELSLLPDNQIFEVFSRDANGNVVKGFGRYSRITKRAEYIEVFLDNGEVIKCTADHKFLLENNQYKAAIDLTIDDKLASYPNLNGGNYVIKIKTEHKVEDVYDITVDIHQNFLLKAGVFVHNSRDGNPPAAMRYTEAKLAEITSQWYDDLREEIIEYQDNFAEDYREPTVLPVTFPNLLVNGADGIAVGMTTSIPPHNLKEVIDATILLANNPDTTLSQLMKKLPGADLPGGGVILNTKETFREIYTNGVGKFYLQGKFHIEQLTSATQAVVITELPFKVGPAKVYQEIIDQTRKEKITEVTTYPLNRSDKTGLRLIVTVKKGGDINKLIKQLLMYTSLRKSVNCRLTALVDGLPKSVSLHEMLQHFIDFRKEIITKRLEYNKNKIEAELELLSATIGALNIIDKVIEIIKSSSNDKESKEKLMKVIKITDLITKKKQSINDRQAQYIIDLQLKKINKLNKFELEEKAKKLLAQRTDIITILESDDKLRELMISELKEVQKKFAVERETNLSDVELEETTDLDKLNEVQEVKVFITSNGYINVTNNRNYKTLPINIDKKSSFIKEIESKSNNNLFVFSDDGYVNRIKLNDFEINNKKNAGKKILSLTNDVVNAFDIEDFNNHKYLVMITKNGSIKKIETELLATTTNIQVLTGDDQVIAVLLANEKENLVVYTRNGKILHTVLDDLRAVKSKSSGGVGICKLSKDDFIKGAIIANKDNLLAITENNLYKLVELEQYSKQSRTAGGIFNIDINKPAKTPAGAVKEVIALDNKEDFNYLDNDNNPQVLAFNKLTKINRSANPKELKIDFKQGLK